MPVVNLGFDLSTEVPEDQELSQYLLKRLNTTICEALWQEFPNAQITITLREVTNGS